MHESFEAIREMRDYRLSLQFKGQGDIAVRGSHLYGVTRKSSFNRDPHDIHYDEPYQQEPPFHGLLLKKEKTGYQGVSRERD